MTGDEENFVGVAPFYHCWNRNMVFETNHPNLNAEGLDYHCQCEGIHAALTEKMYLDWVKSGKKPGSIEF